MDAWETHAEGAAVRRAAAPARPKVRVRKIGEPGAIPLTPAQAELRQLGIDPYTFRITEVPQQQRPAPWTALRWPLTVGTLTLAAVSTVLVVMAPGARLGSKLSIALIAATAAGVASNDNTDLRAPLSLSFVLGVPAGAALALLAQRFDLLDLTEIQTGAYAIAGWGIAFLKIAPIKRAVVRRVQSGRAAILAVALALPALALLLLRLDA